MSRPKKISLDRARRLALTAAGLTRARPKKAGVPQLRQLIRRLGLLQIDYVNVLVPAHYQVPFSRLGPFAIDALDELVYRRREFTEQWAHEASIIPMESWPLLEYRRRSHRVRPTWFAELLEQHQQYVDDVLDAVRQRGPLTADKLPDPETIPKRLLDKWGWGRSVKRHVAEVHFGYGRLAVADRKNNFARAYDLTERVVPKQQINKRVTEDEAKQELILQAARGYGVATMADLADYFRMPVKTVRPQVDRLVEQQQLTPITVQGWREPAFMHPQAKASKPGAVSTLLSPFDPLIWYRRRVARMFDFDYRIEIFVPEAKRRWGYYVLPLLHRGELVARVDLKADRKSETLIAAATYIEKGQEKQRIAKALAAELQAWAGWLSLKKIVARKKGNLARDLSKQL